jgi:serine/threonine-protein kinase
MIDAGGQGAVFRARAEGGALSELSEVALKIYFEDQIEERGEREVAALKTLWCSTIVKLYDAGHCNIRGKRCMYIATAFIRGKTIASALRDGQMDIGQIARIGHDVSLAIESMWGLRLVHRDIKPDNVMIRDDGGATLIDLGIARHLSMNTLTTTGKTWGTEGYFSPEHAKASPLSCKSDVFSLGIVLQECLLGRHPTARRQSLLMAGGPKTSNLRGDIPPGLASVVDAMVHRSAVHRPQPAAIAQAMVRFF